MKKIAILTPTFSQFSGIDRLVERQAEDYSKEGYEVTIVCFKAEIKTKYAKVIELGMPKNQTLERIYRLFYFLMDIEIDKVADQLKGFDKIICHFYPMSVIASKAKEKYGIHYEYHNAGVADANLFDSFIEGTYMRLFRLLTNHYMKKADEIICISDFLRDVVKKEINMESNLEYVKIDTKRFHKGIDGSRIKEKYGIKPKDKLCLYVGRLSPHKGIDLLLKVINKLNGKYKLLIVGKPTFDKYFEMLKEMASDRVTFVGFVPDSELPEYYAACDTYVTASKWEGFAMPIVEAAECGKPSVAFNIAAHPEVLKNGKLVKFGDIEAFAKAVVELNEKM